MKTNSNFLGYIERYLGNDLNKEELQQFEKELAVNKSLQKELVFHKEVNAAISQDKVMDLRAKLQKTYMQAVKPSRIINWYYHVAAAASVAILLGVSMLLLQGRNYSGVELYARYFEPYEATTNIRSGNTSLDIILQEAMAKYEQSDYNGALVLFGKILEKDRGNLATNLYSGISYLETKQFKQAINSFEYIKHHKNNLFTEHAHWYLGCCYLRMDDLAKAKAQFNEIASSNSFYKEKADDILKDMRK